jgi:hypothetical protein
LIIFFIANPNLHAQIIKDDFRVNDDTTGGGNRYPVVEMMDDGKTIVVWEDGRNGYSNIYGQFYNTSGDSMGTNFKVSTFQANSYENRPAISSYGDSILVIFTYGYAQWLLSDGTQSGYTKYLQSGTIYYPDVAVSDSGFFVVWHYIVSGSGNEVFLMRFDFDGDSIGPRIIINDDGTSEDQYYPRIAMDNEGNFVVVWVDNRNVSANSEIYGQLFNPSGSKIGSNFLINDDGGSYQQYSPSCAMDWAGNFVVVWEDYRDDDVNIYGQRFDASGDTTGLGGNFLINDDGLSINQSFPSCAMDSSGNFVVVWFDYRNGNYDIYGQRFDNTGMSLGINFRIDQCPGSETQFDPRVSMNENNFVVTWWDDRNSTSIYKRRFLNDGTPVGDEVKVNELDGTANQQSPAVDMNVAGDVVVTWEDNRSPWGIYFQRLNAVGDELGENLRVAYGWEPDVSVGEDGSYVITYYYSDDIYYKMFTQGGDSIGPPAIANDTSLSQRYSPSIDMDTLGNFVITWHDYRRGDSDIYAVMVDSTGDTVGSNFRVNDDAGTAGQYSPAIAMSPSDRFIITWYDYRNDNYDIFGQVYDATGDTEGSNFRINTDAGTDDQYSPDVASFSNGNFITVWQDGRGPSGIYAQVVDSTGAFVGTNFMVSDVDGYEPSVSVSPSGEFVITWFDYREGNYSIYAQRYNPDYSPDGINYKVNNKIEGLNKVQFGSDVATDGTNIIFTWQDAKWQRGWDIAVKVVDWNFTSVDEKEHIEVSTMLLPNLPNPFINSTLIRYQTKIKQKISIKIYDLSGRLITTLLDDLVEPGVHSQRWDGKDVRGREVPAGIYFCRLDALNKSESRKLVLLR